nr:protein SPIRAL1-like 1 [Tanacetum cinerariifolium]
ISFITNKDEPRSEQRWWAEFFELLVWGGEAPKPALKATQAGPCETLAANNVSAAKPDPVSPPIYVTKQIPA